MALWCRSWPCIDTSWNLQVAAGTLRVSSAHCGLVPTMARVESPVPAARASCTGSCDLGQAMPLREGAGPSPASHGPTHGPSDPRTCLPGRGADGMRPRGGGALGCCGLCSFCTCRGAAGDEIMHQDIVPLCAADIQDQLKKRFAYLSGGRGQDGSPVITFPDYPAFSEIPDKEFQNVMTYLTSIPSLQDAGIGFILVIDRRRDKWTSVKASVLRIALRAHGTESEPCILVAQAFE
ncbi:guanine nucleotide exchange factor DBS [Theropithecus gelada]|uniref:guanine nucleotide exchange factor DBS n=1 Tax=Theropithecus gelada TaxID=9565 RepID=UPI000DC15FA8|nr:guanine nucleotide exchange factor DBS [Theropithecus gelada]